MRSPAQTCKPRQERTGEEQANWWTEARFWMMDFRISNFSNTKIYTFNENDQGENVHNAFCEFALDSCLDLSSSEPSSIPNIELFEHKNIYIQCYARNVRGDKAGSLGGTGILVPPDISRIARI